jgi:hypothetical protein
MVASIHALNQVKSMLQNGPLTKDEIQNRIRMRRAPTNMELVGLLKKSNGIEKNADGKYQLIKNA